MAPSWPLVSVVLPAKDAEVYIADALASLTTQFRDPYELEVVVVNDGSTDATMDVVASFYDRLPNLLTIENSTPSGLATARNQGLTAMSGRYVAFLDADDWLAPHRLSRLAEAMSTLRVNFIRTDYTTVYGIKRRLKRAPQARRGVPLDPRASILPVHETTMVDHPNAWAGIFDAALAREDLLRFPDGLHTAEDRPWIWRLFLYARTYAVVDAPTILYRRGLQGSLTSSVDHRMLDILTALQLILEMVNADEESSRYLPKIARTALALVAYHISRDAHMASHVRKQLLEGSRELLASLPPSVLRQAVDNIGVQRKQALQDVLPDFTYVNSAQMNIGDSQ